jgi:predicted dehydrogenase
MTTPKPVEIALLGAGARGELNLATLAKKHPETLRITAVAEPHVGRREQFAKKFGISPQNAFEDWQQMLARPKLADAVLNALPCRMHFESTREALNAGYDVFLEKPMALTPGESVRLVNLAEDLGRVFMISLQSRYNKIYTRVRSLLDGGSIGELMNIDCAENIGYWHFILSYVRGIHYRSSLSHSFVLAKGIHDLDLVTWFAGARAARISSFGSLAFFHEGNAPEGAPERCMDGCPVFDTCEFNAYKQFVKPGKPDIPFSLLTGMSLGALTDWAKNPRFRTLASVIVHDISKESRIKALEETINGRCVFRSDNDVVDRQTVSIEYENGVVASFSLSGFSVLWERTLNLHGTKGEIRSADFSGRLELRSFNPGRVQRKRIRYHGIIHGGGDEAILVKFAQAVRERNPDRILASAKNCLESHLVCFAAEEARVSGEVVDMETFRQRADEDAAALV